MELIKKYKQYLENKHKGGVSNQKGGLYEDYYAVYQIASCLYKYKENLNQVTFQTQLQDTFVDDLLIVNPNQNLYHQLKNTNSLTWGDTEKQGDIAFDFNLQIENCTSRDEDFILKLIYSQENCNVSNKIPKAIQKYSIAEYFEYKDNLTDLVLSSQPLQDALKAIAPQDITSDEVVNIATLFLGIWKGCGSKEQISLENILNKAKNFPDIKLNLFKNISISTKCKNILDNINGLSHHISGKNFCWRFGKLTGQCQWTDEIEDKIQRVQPKDVWNLLEILP